MFGDTRGTSVSLHNLPEFEWFGSFSVHDDLEYPLAKYCVANAIILDKFICDPQNLATEFDDPKKYS